MGDDDQDYKDQSGDDGSGGGTDLRIIFQNTPTLDGTSLHWEGGDVALLSGFTNDHLSVLTQDGDEVSAMEVTGPDGLWPGQSYGQLQDIGPLDDGSYYVNIQLAWNYSGYGSHGTPGGIVQSGNVYFDVSDGVTTVTNWVGSTD